MNSTTTSAEPRPRPLEPLDPQIRSIQPGGGLCMSLELAWGRLRRAYLKTFRKGYVARMAEQRRGDPTGYPIEILDPRDLKYFQNQGDLHWPPENDPFAWRDRLPFARVGLAELLLLGGSMFALAVGLAFIWWPLAIAPALLWLEVVWFFRNPRRVVPTEPGLVVAPADGLVVAIEEIEHDEFLGGPAVMIGIFLSVFNVHINRSPVAGRVIGLSYRRGKFLNAMRAASARENEQLELRLEETEAPYRAYRVRQIAGAIARRIVCWVRPGTPLGRGEQFGMIKLGSRTEIVLPREPSLNVLIRKGQSVQAGTTILARYER